MFTRGKTVLCVIGALCAMSAAQAAGPIQVGIALDISGPFAALGADASNGFDLAIEKLGGKLGGQPAEFLKTDFGGNPEQATQLVTRYLQRDKIDFFTGPIASNTALAVGPALFAAKVPFISSNPGPSQFAGKQCSPYFFGQYQNDNHDEAAGVLVNEKGYKNVVLIAPNYPAGKDHLGGFKRTYKGEVAGEIYTKVGQIDYAAEIAQIRSTRPGAVYFFLPGAMGINFIKQYAAAGLDSVPLVSGGAVDQDIVDAVGGVMAGMSSTTQWANDLSAPGNVEFVKAYRKKYDGRYPSLYAAQAYDTILAMDAAVRIAGGVADRDKLVAALRQADYESVRGRYKFGPNNFPIQNYYQRVVYKDADGRYTNKLVGTVLENHQDAYAADCKMP
ncbi:ABC transporter substrate-binding protein [Azoarcus indigens]|uniref:Amino acid/amide ABC transporter substrate-binding protein (HAAT family) n=1 Tax=Azoarcus indigens TaxID=29545 RepID=A0A4R6DPF5_9RHOO|nr:ABC transporter substrate-binding protein [Azoarcus indigens]NMG66004.1 ABC transporter substrate-binding protein [Azoarcus indigens]TDN46895.1 amino acid/amide ABC transporter substrate-binding protein (HAAT family) [Azoarcus indigens]